MDRLRARIKDKRVLALVKAFLKAGVMTADGEREESYAGTPAGGILSPLLANIALSALDDHFTRQWQEQMGTRWQREKRRRKGLGTWRLVRYADDWVILVNGTRAHAEALREEAAAVLAPLGLRLAEEKTRVVHIDEGFDFLGFTIRRMRKRGTEKHYVYTVPSRKAIQAVKDKISAKTYRSTRHRTPACSSRASTGPWPGGRTTSVTECPKTYSARSTPTRGAGSCAGCGTSTPTWGCRNCAAASACAEPGSSPPTGSGSPARSQCRSPATATAAASRRRGHPGRSQRPASPSGQGTWSARCAERRTPGAAGGPGKPTRRDSGRAPRSDPTNLAEYAEKTVAAHRGCLKDQPGGDDADGTGAPGTAATLDQEPPEQGERAIMPDGSLDACGRERRLVIRTRERYAEIHQRLDAGESLSGISRATGLDRKTVQRFARAGSAGELLGKATSRESKLDDFTPYLRQRWNDGVTDAAALHAELRERGWTGSEQTVRRYVRPFRQALAAPDPTPAVPKTRQITRWLLTRRDRLQADERAQLQAIRARCPHIDALAGHVTAFAEMMTARTGSRDLEAWLAAVEADDQAGLRSFTIGIRHDMQAVTNGLTLHWNSGRVEGTVNKIKMIKRQMYGRASFDLLRKRVILHPA